MSVKAAIRDIDRYAAYTVLVLVCWMFALAILLPHAGEAAKPRTSQPTDEVEEPLNTWGQPEGTAIEINKYTRAAFDGQTRVARWTLEYLTPATVGKRAERVDAWRADERIPKEFRPTPQDYLGADFDRGHLAPAGDFGSDKLKAATFTFSNCAPQDAKLNRGLWRALEKQIRDRVGDNGRVWVMTCPVFGPLEPRNEISRRFVEIQVVGPHNVMVPTAFGKATLELHGEQSKPRELRAWLVPNKEPKASAVPDDFLVPVDVLEAKVGLNLWSELDEDLQNELEAK